ncbi:MAG: HAD family phosphatase [Aestuariivirga sp.]
MTRVKLRAVAWDVDGTLVDSEPLHHRSLLIASKNFGVDLSNLPDQAFQGVHMKDVWSQLRHRMPNTLKEAEWLEAINDHYVAHRHELVAESGAVETIRVLKARSIPQVCVSNSSRRIVDANLDALGIADLMVATISLDDVQDGKPSPEPYLNACLLLDLEPAAVLAIEDSATGIASAIQAGLPCLSYKMVHIGSIGAIEWIDNISDVLSRF